MNNLKSGSLICFTGIDGSGKTTLAKEINQYLNNQGFKSVYVYGRIYPFFSRLLMGIGRIFILKKKKSDIFADYDTYISTKQKKLNHSLLGKIYVSTMLLEQIFQIYIKIVPRLLLGRIILCDRYIFDTVITDLAVDFRYTNEDVTRQIKFLLYFVPKPDLIFFLDIDEETAFSRKNDIPDIRYIVDRKKVYISQLDSFNIMKINARDSVPNIRDEVLKKISVLP